MITTIRNSFPEKSDFFKNVNLFYFNLYYTIPKTNILNWFGSKNNFVLLYKLWLNSEKIKDIDITCKLNI